MEIDRAREQLQMALRRRFTKVKKKQQEQIEIINQKKIMMASKRFDFQGNSEIKRVHRFRYRNKIKLFPKRRLKWTDWSMIQQLLLFFTLIFGIYLGLQFFTMLRGANNFQKKVQKNIDFQIKKLNNDFGQKLIRTMVQQLKDNFNNDR